MYKLLSTAEMYTKSLWHDFMEDPNLLVGLANLQVDAKGMAGDGENAGKLRLSAES